MENVVLVGAGGHCRSVIDAIEAGGIYQIAAVVDKQENIGQSILNYPIDYCDDDLSMLAQKYKNFVITVGQIKSPEARISIFNQIKKMGGRLVTVISPTAYVSRHAKIGEGTVVLHRAVVNAGAIIGDNCIINTMALLEHDVKIANHCHISTAVVLNGGVSVQEASFVGSTTVVHQNCVITARSVVTAGAVITKRGIVGPYDN